jgi:hypothetical protein
MIHADKQSLAPAPSPSIVSDVDRPVLAALAKALTTATAGETQYANGLIKITTPSGHSYCFQPKAWYARGGPGDGTSIPTNCP